MGFREFIAVVDQDVLLRWIQINSCIYFAT